MDLLTPRWVVMVMARFRRAMALRPVQRIKHVTDQRATLAAAAELPLSVVIASDTPDLATEEEVQTGSTVHGIFLKCIVASNETTVAGAIPNVYMIVFKNPGNNLVLPASDSVGNNDNKRFVIHQEMVMIENQISGNPTTLFQGVIAIPRGYRRFGPNDRLQVQFLSPQINISVCLQCIYKEFR